jgi:uncharacterized Zn finger protein
MKCPVCSNHDHRHIHLHAAGFHEGIIECQTCGAVWAISHGLAEVVRDPQAQSFLSAISEAVEGDDYCWVA